MRRSWIKSVATGVGILMLLASIAAREASAAGERTFHFAALVSMVKPVNDFYGSVLKEWGKMKGVQVTFESIAHKDMDYKIATWTETGNGPDLFSLTPALGILIQDKLLDLSDVAQKIIQRFPGGFYETVMAQSVTPDGRWISMPVVRDQSIMFYRKDFLKMIGETKPPATWEQLRDYSQRIKKSQGEGKIGKDVAICALPLGRSSDAAGWYEMIKYAYGSLLVKKDGKTLVFDSPQTLEAVKFIGNLFEKDKLIPEGAAGWDDNTNNSLWYAGKAGFTFNTPSITFVTKRKAPDVWKVTGTASVPGGPGGRGFFSTDRTFASLKNEKHPDLVKDFLLYFFREENMKKFMELAEGTYSPVLKSLANLPVYKLEENVPLIEEINEARYPGWPGPVTRSAVEVYSRRLTADMIGRVTVDKISPEAAVKETTKKIEEIYARSR